MKLGNLIHSFVSKVQVQLFFDCLKSYKYLSLNLVYNILSQSECQDFGVSSLCLCLCVFHSFFMLLGYPQCRKYHNGDYIDFK